MVGSCHYPYLLVSHRKLLSKLRLAYTVAYANQSVWSPVIHYCLMYCVFYSLPRFQYYNGAPLFTSQLTHLLYMLDFYPSFSVAGYYRLSKARLVDVSFNTGEVKNILLNHKP